MDILDGFEVTDPMHGGKINVRIRKTMDVYWADGLYPYLEFDGEDFQIGPYEEYCAFFDKEDARKLYLTLGALLGLTTAP